MKCILYIVVSGDLLKSLFRNTSNTMWMVIVGIILLPCAALPNLKSVSRFSCICSIGQFLVYFVIMAHCLATMPDLNEAWSKVKFYADWEQFSVGMGAIVFSYTSQFYLPALEADMENKKYFKPMLYWSHWIAAFFKTLFALVCYLRYTENTAEM